MLAIIPARGGSKGIPKKNISYVCGKPLIAWTILAAKKAKTISKVVVSTDDPKIAEVSRKYGAEVVWRSADISGDFSPSEDAIFYTLNVLKTKEKLPEVTVFLQCTSPLTTPDDIDGAVNQLLKGVYDVVFSVTPCDLTLWNDHGCVNFNPLNRPATRQARQKNQYVETGAVYAFRTKGFLENKNRFFGSIGYQITPGPYCEIDNFWDLELAEILLRKKQKFDIVPAALVLDFDGVFTDDSFILHEDGTESVVCRRGDGHILRELDIPIFVLSGEKNSVVKKRCQKLNIPCIVASDKLTVLKEILFLKDLRNVVYVGNDLNDIGCMGACYAVVPADAYKEVLPYADYILNAKGGQGVIREVVSLIKNSRKG